MNKVETFADVMKLSPPAYVAYVRDMLAFCRRYLPDVDTNPDLRTGMMQMMWHVENLRRFSD